MQLQAVVLVAVLSHLALAGAWDVNFRISECYRYGLDNLADRMPISIYNLIALVEKMENAHTYTNPDALSEALLHRYRIDGITYTSMDTASNWNPNDQYEVYKYEIYNSLITMDQTVPEFTFDPREECSLHFMLSHSVDLYPHAGLDEVWNNVRRRRRRQADIRLSLPNGMQPATHPIENGVIWTPSGPVSGGTLLGGIMVTDTSLGMTIRDIYQSQSLEYMPDAMIQKRVMPLHAMTLAGDIGQAAIYGYVAHMAANELFLGPMGMFGNSTAAPKLFTFERNDGQNIPYLTRAEVFAGIDSLLIQKVMRQSSNNYLKLSDALRMYYSDHGLPGYPEYRACNRMQAFKDLDINLIREQTLNYMYAYSGKVPSIKLKLSENREDFPIVENVFNNALDLAWKEFINLVDNYDYSEFSQCPTLSTNEPKCENKVDLLTVYSYDGGETETEKERKYITHLAQMVDVGLDRSRIGVLDGKTARWIFPMTNFSNVADWGSNFTESKDYSYGSGSDMNAVMAEITSYYYNFYQHMRSDPMNASANAQVVLWNAPSSIPEQEKFKQVMDNFRLIFPDVYFLFVGKNKGAYTDLMVDQNKDFFVNNGQDMLAFAKTLAKRICQIPSVFVYPACNPNNANFTSVSESSHIYTGYISPNFTTYIKIAPHYFHFSEWVKLKVSEGDVSVCSSRTSMDDYKNNQDKECSQSGDMEFWYLCGRLLAECDPIYLSVMGTSTANNLNCQDVECQYPNQIKYQIRHEGMTCGAWAAPPSLLLLVTAVLSLLLQSQH